MKISKNFPNYFYYIIINNYSEKSWNFILIEIYKTQMLSWKWEILLL